MDSANKRRPIGKRFSGVSDHSVYTYDADNLMAWWWDGLLTEGVLPFQIGSEWERSPVKVPIQGLREHFLRKVLIPPPEWEGNFATYFGKSFSRVAFPQSHLLRDKVIGHYFPRTEHFVRNNNGALPVYKIPPHHVCDYMFTEVTRLRFPDFKAFQGENDGKPPTSIWTLV